MCDPCALFARTDARTATRCAYLLAGLQSFFGREGREYSGRFTNNMPTESPARHCLPTVRGLDDALSARSGPASSVLSLRMFCVHRTRSRGPRLAGQHVLHRGKSNNARERNRFGGAALAENQGSSGRCSNSRRKRNARLLIRKTAWENGSADTCEFEHTLSARVSICNFLGDPLCCEAADRAIRCPAAWLLAAQAVRTHLPASPAATLTEGSEDSRAKWRISVQAIWGAGSSGGILPFTAPLK